MGPDLELERIIDEILKDLASFDGSVEKGIEIIQANEVRMERLKELFAEGVDLGSYEEKLREIVEKQKELVEALKGERVALLNKLKQLNMKNKVVDNYMSTRLGPIFVDKDL